MKRLLVAFALAAALPAVAQEPIKIGLVTALSGQSARAGEAITRGEYQWVVAELHPPLALLQHGFYWSCPDKDGLSRSLETAAAGRPSFHFGLTGGRQPPESEP